MLDTTKPLISLNEMEIYHEEMVTYIKSLGLGLSEEDINGLIDEKLVPVNTTIKNKVEKVDGKGLSTNDYSDTDKEKVNSIPSDAKFTDTVYNDTELNNRIDSVVETVDTKADKNHNHDENYDFLGSASSALTSAKEYVDTKTANLASTTVVDNKISTHNSSSSAHSDIRELISGLTTRLNTLADSDDITLDQMSEIVAYIKSNKSLIDSITTSKINVSDIVNNLTTANASKVLSANQGVVIKGLIDALQSELDSHTHAIADVSGLQSALDSKASNSHGTHVSYSTTVPVMDGTANVGTANTVARSDHKHPTDTSRASVSDLTTHTGNTTAHITSTERTNWNDANSKKHVHNNKSVLDATTASYTVAEKEKLGTIGSITTTQIDALFA